MVTGQYARRSNCNDDDDDKNDDNEGNDDDDDDNDVVAGDVSLRTETKV